jgi:phosphate transport system permease protein
MLTREESESPLVAATEQIEDEEQSKSNGTIAKQFIKQRFSSKRRIIDTSFTILFFVAIVLIIIPFFSVLYTIIIDGWDDVFGSGPSQGIEFFTTLPGASQHGGILNGLVGTIALGSLASLVGIPLSVLGAVYITEYAKPGRFRRMIEFGADVLAGIPSIVFGAFGLALFVDGLGLSKGLLAGSLTLAFMMIPTILRTTQEALRAVPMTLREASLALGATKWSTTWRVTVRAAFPGIVTGILLAFGRIVGETAPLILTAGYSIFTPTGLDSYVASMPFLIWFYYGHSDPVLRGKAPGVALSLLLMVLAVDVIANLVSRKVTRRLV